jgi:hypothetical protein
MAERVGFELLESAVDKMGTGLAVAEHQDSLLERSFRRFAASVRRFLSRARWAFAVAP